MDRLSDNIRTMNQPTLVLAITIASVLPVFSQNANIEARYGLDKAKANMSTFTVAPGLGAALFAAEPMMQNPTNIEVDHRGRVWATECTNYRGHMSTRAEGDRVVILEDTDGDGLADSEKTFYQSKDLTNPLGICVLPSPTGKGTQVIVSAAPNVWLLTDKDGDDKAEEAVVLFKVGGVWNYDHQIHSFMRGPEGKFYFNAGNSITELKWPDDSIVTDLVGNKITNKGEPYRQGMVYRCDIDLSTGKASNVETLGHNFRNNYEVAIDSFGTMWQSDNDDDGNKGVRICYVMEHGNFGYTDEFTGAGWQSKRTNMETEIPLRHWYLNDPGVVPNLLQTGAGSPTGLLVNESKTLGAQFENQMIHCDAGPRTVRSYPVVKDGAGYKATMVDVLTSTDSWYRVSDVAIAPDGSLVVADWYDPGVGGHAMGDHEPGKIMGRLYRVAPAGVAKAAAADFSTAESAAVALTSPNRVIQATAWSALHAMGAKAEPALLGLWKSTDARIRARALGLLSQLKGSEIKYLAAGLTDADENIRIWSIRLCSTLHRSKRIDTTPLDSDLALVGKLHREHDIAKLWVALAQQHDGKDRWYLEALGIGSAKNEDACFDAWLSAVGDKWNTPAGRDIVWRTRSVKAAGYLAKLLQDKESAHLRYMRSFDFLPKGDARNAALIEIATSGKASEEIAREALGRLKGVNNDAVAKAISGALEKAKDTAAFIQLARDFGAKGQGAALLATAVKLGNDPAAGDAVKLILNDGDWEKVLNDGLAGADAESVIKVLAASGSGRATSKLTALFTDAQQKPEHRKAAVGALSRTQAGADSLVKLAKEGKFPEDLKLSAASAFAAVQYPTLAKDIAALFPMPSAQGGKPLPAIAELAKLTGDVEKGRVIFERTESTCVTCHTAAGKGVEVGPGLSEIGSKLPKEAIFESILNPNSGLSMGFETQLFTLKDGGVASGIVRSETKEEITVALPGGATQNVAKNNIAKREKLTTSLMPAGLSNVLTQDDLVNLVEYLASLKKK
jgi:putative membrane-bound dehydrogenase-like protein